MSPWHSQVIASDASEFGLGLVRRRVAPAVVAQIGRQSERWRYRVEGGARARERALGPVIVSSSFLPSVLLPLEFLSVPESSFDEAPRDVLEESSWAGVAA
eukprot:1221530-Pyramimonas_sp.AAC.1